jgi:hypothetical protein
MDSGIHSWVSLFGISNSVVNQSYLFALRALSYSVPREFLRISPGGSAASESSSLDPLGILSVSRVLVLVPIIGFHKSPQHLDK